MRFEILKIYMVMYFFMEKSGTNLAIDLEKIQRLA